MKRVIFILFAVAFAVFAFLNLNDPDPIPWVAAYGATAILAALAAFGRAHRVLVGVVGVAMFVWMCTMIPGIVEWFLGGMPSIVDEMQATEPHIEVVREFLGLFIAVLALGVMFTSIRPRN